jgi:hypothetical protein
MSASSSMTSISPPKPRRTLRKSCHFCRSRKIKCSGDTICEACRERGIECAYKEGEPKGRPKVLSRVYSAPNVPDLQSEAEQHSSSYDKSWQPRQSSADDNSITYHQFSKLPAVSLPSLDRFGNTVTLRPDEISIAASILDSYSWIDHNTQGTPTNLTNQKLALFTEQTLIHNSTVNEKLVSGSCDVDFSYEDIFFTIAQELMELLALRLGEIGCSQLDRSRSHFFLKAYMADTTVTMFDAPSPPSGSPTGMFSASSVIVTETMQSKVLNPLHEYDGHQMVQMMEIWFSQHPFSSMLSKTLLLRDIRQETYDDVLVAVMLGDVEAVQETTKSRAKSHALYAWASTRLNAISQENLRLSLIQAIVLLGWHALCTRKARRALVLLVWADSHVRSMAISKPGANIVNGVDMGEVEAESLCNTQWLTFSIYQWIMMQAQVTVRDLSFWDVPTALPTADLTSLAILRLDRASYSISTLQSQERAYRELWLLSYVAAFTSQIYRLCPQVPPPAEVAEASQGWQSHVLNRLRGLPDPMKDILVICTQVRHVLTDIVRTIHIEAQCSTSQAVEILIAHTILIHLLLPSWAETIDTDPNALSNLNALGARRVLAAGGIQKLISDFCCSMTALLKIFAVLKGTNLGSPRTARITMSHPASTTDYIIFMALDACMRGLKSLWFLNCNGTDMEKFYVNEKREEFQHFAEELRNFSKGLDRVDVVRLGLVIEQLEFVICHFAGLELEEQSSTLPSSRASGSSNKTKARTPPPGMIIGTIMQTNDHGFDLGDSSSMDFMTNDAIWCDLMPMQTPLLDHNGWSMLS